MYGLFISLFVSLLPLAIYLLILSQINRKTASTMISGRADMIGMLMGLSGMLLFMGPWLMQIWYYRFVTTPIEEGGLTTLESIWSRFMFLWLGYYFVILSGAGWMIWGRRNATAIYNVDRLRLEAVLSETLASHGLGQARSGTSLFVGPQEESASNPSETPSPAETTPLQGKLSIMPRATLTVKDTRHAHIRVDDFPLLQNLTFHWVDASPGLQEIIETDLRGNLDRTAPDDNPAAGWLLGLSAVLFGMLLTVTALAVMLAYFPPRH